MFRHINQMFGYMPEDITESFDKPVLHALPKFGDHMTKKDFLENVIDGGFVDYDGYGLLATATQESSWCVHPSIANEPWPEWATHVVWYNR